MLDWDDIRFFLAVAREGSVRAAAARLNVNHSTVLRRIGQLEGRLTARMFEKLPAGYRLTSAGAEVLALAEQMEQSLHQLEARVQGRDQNVRGPLRVTMPPTLATHLLMPDFAEFACLHPEIELDLHSSDEPVNLTNRQADVALRVVYERASLPLNLHGVMGPAIFGGVYISRELLEAWRGGPPQTVRWIDRDFYGLPDWARDGDIPIAETMIRTSDAGAHLAALRQGMGMTGLSCFVGDADPTLTRAPGSRLNKHGTLWLLTQGETRKTKRVRLFVEFITRRLTGYAALLEGRSPSSQDLSHAAAPTG